MPGSLIDGAKSIILSRGSQLVTTPFEFGRLVLVKIDGVLVFPDKDSTFTRCLEKLPVMGMMVGGAHWLTGNPDHAARAIATSVNSTTVTAGMVIGTAIGIGLGSPHIGCIIGAALATPCGILAEVTIANAFIKDPRVRADIQEATLGRIIYETLLNMVGGAAGGAGGALAGWLGKAITPGIDAVMQGLVAALLRRGIVVSVKLSLYAILKKVKDLLEGKRVESWDIAMQALNDIKKNRPSHFA